MKKKMKKRSEWFRKPDKCIKKENDRGMERILHTRRRTLSIWEFCKISVLQQAESI